MLINFCLCPRHRGVQSLKGSHGVPSKRRASSTVRLQPAWMESFRAQIKSKVNTLSLTSGETAPRCARQVGRFLMIIHVLLRSDFSLKCARHGLSPLTNLRRDERNQVRAANAWPCVSAWPWPCVSAWPCLGRAPLSWRVAAVGSMSSMWRRRSATRCHPGTGPWDGGRTSSLPSSGCEEQ